eukprot:1159500-Pelagomonas_calceolata.AAC.20
MPRLLLSATVVYMELTVLLSATAAKGLTMLLVATDALRADFAPQCHHCTGLSVLLSATAAQRAYCAPQCHCCTEGCLCSCCLPSQKPPTHKIIVYALQMQ